MTLSSMRGSSNRLGDIARAAGATEIAAEAPEWVHLLPAGVVQARDGRELWQLSDPAAVVAATRARGMDLVVDYEHQTDRAEKNGQPAPAAGWLRDLEARPDGIWGRIEWTARAREMIARRDYRFLSPVFAFERESRRVTRHPPRRPHEQPGAPAHRACASGRTGSARPGRPLATRTRPYRRRACRLPGAPRLARRLPAKPRRLNRSASAVAPK